MLTFQFSEERGREKKNDKKGNEKVVWIDDESGGEGYSCLRNVKASVRAYVEARHKLNLLSDVIDSEAQRLYSALRDYVKSRDGQIQSFSDVLVDFYSEILGLDGSEDRWIRSSLTRRFKRLMRKHGVNDPRYQKSLDDFIWE